TLPMPEPSSRPPTTGARDFFLPAILHPPSSILALPPMGLRAENLEQFAIDVILERRRGVRAVLLRALLYALSFIYERAVQLRLFLYRKRIFREHALGCLVISIGNLTVGGTGKTPIVEKFARAMRAGGRRVAILSRGYKSVPRPPPKKWWQQLARKKDPVPPRI